MVSMTDTRRPDSHKGKIRSAKKIQQSGNGTNEENEGRHEKKTPEHQSNKWQGRGGLGTENKST